LKGVIDYVYTISVVGSVPNKEYCSCSTTFDLRVFWEDAKSEKERLAREENLKKEKESNMTDFQRRKRLERANTEEEVKARKARVEEKRRAKNADSKTAEDGQEDAVECENCEEHVADVYCRECDMSLCFSNNCDDDFHKPVKMRKHRRVLLKEHALSQNAKATMSYEKYAEGGKEIKRYECEDDFGFFYVYKNHSPRLQLEEILEFSELKNLVLKGKGLAEQAKIRVYVPPNGSAEVHFKKLQPRDACSVQVLQHISVTPGGKGKHSSVSPAAALADLKERALKEGEAEDYDDVKEGVGKEIVRYSYKHTEGYCFLYVNKNAKYQLIEQLEFEMKNLQIHGEEPDVRQIKITVPPGQEQFVELVTVARKKGFSLEVSSATRLKKCKSKW
jgi:hypothetical protein